MSMPPVGKHSENEWIKECTDVQFFALSTFVDDFADALVEVDRSRVCHKHFQPGIGPFGEADAIRCALLELKKQHSDRYSKAVTKRLPDLLIPNAWALELKIVRPFGDNGMPAEHWSENILHPYPGNTSSLGDCLKLIGAGFSERKAVVIFGYEHSPAQISLDNAICAFELIAMDILRIKLGPKCHATREGLVHPVHQVLRVFGYEVLGSA
jgi:hypothetical protein